MKIVKPILICCFCITIGYVNAFALEALPLATGEWPPHTTETMVEYGIVSEIVTAVVKEMGMEPRYSFYPWKRAEDLVEKGKVFGVFPYAHTAEREKKYDFSDDFFPGGDILIFYNTKKIKEEPSWETLKDLKTYKIGAVIGYWYQEELQKAGLQLELVESDEQNFFMLHAKRIDITLAEEHAGWWFVRNLFPEEVNTFAVFKKPFAKKTKNGGLMISRSYPNADQLQIKFNQALLRIKKNGVYQRIINKYGIPTP